MLLGVGDSSLDKPFADAALLLQILPCSSSGGFPSFPALQAPGLTSDGVKQSRGDAAGIATKGLGRSSGSWNWEQEAQPGLPFPLYPGLWCSAAAPDPGTVPPAPLCSQERACSLPLRSDFTPWMRLWKNQPGHNAAVCSSQGQGRLEPRERGCSFPDGCKRPDQTQGMPSPE